MNIYETLEATYYQWVNNPEPNRIEMDTRTILDANLEQTVWLYNYENEETEWLTYHGEPMECVQ